MNKEYGCDNCGREEVNLFLLPDGREVCEECKKEIELAKMEPSDYKRILKVTPLPDTKTGNWLSLECGHSVMSFGNLDYLQGVVLCVKCLALG